MPVTLTISSLEVLRKLCTLAVEDDSLRIVKNGALVSTEYLHYGDRITLDCGAGSPGEADEILRLLDV